MKRLLIVPALFLILPSGHAQDATEPATFTSNTNLVIIDVNVRDKSGNVIPNLNLNDFTLLEDGKPQKISVFDFQKLEGDTLLKPVPAAKPVAEAPAAAPKINAAARKAAVTSSPTSAAP